MLELSRHPDGSLVLVDPRSVAAVLRPDDGEYTEIVFNISSSAPQPFCLRIMELPADVLVQLQREHLRLHEETMRFIHAQRQG